MSRTYTAEKPFFFLSRDFGDVTFTFSTDASKPMVSISIPEGSHFTPDPHWHERYVEYIRVTQGRARVVINGVKKLVTPEDGEQTIHPFEVHEFMRADIDSPKDQKDQGEVVIQERVEPADGLKEVFFRNLFSAIQDPHAFGKLHSLQIMAISNAYDNYPVLVSGPLSWMITRSVFACASGLAWLLNLRPWYQEYTPERIRGVAESKGFGAKAKTF